MIPHQQRRDVVGFMSHPRSEGDQGCEEWQWLDVYNILQYNFIIIISLTLLEYNYIDIFIL